MLNYQKWGWNEPKSGFDEDVPCKKKCPSEVMHALLVANSRWGFHVIFKWFSGISWTKLALEQGVQSKVGFAKVRQPKWWSKLQSVWRIRRCNQPLVVSLKWGDSQIIQVIKPFEYWNNHGDDWGSLILRHHDIEKLWKVHPYCIDGDLAHAIFDGEQLTLLPDNTRVKHDPCPQTSPMDSSRGSSNQWFRMMNSSFPTNSEL